MRLLSAMAGMMRYTHLLAKSCSDPENPPYAATLAGHTKTVLLAFKCLFGTAAEPTRLCRQWFVFFGLSENIIQVFFTTTRLACLFHDIGKAGSGFQSMIRRKGQQLIRHEHFSAILLHCPELRRWIEKTPNADIDIVISAVLGHHLKADPRNNNLAENLLGIDYSRFFLNSEALTELLREICGSVEELPPLQESFSCPQQWDFFKDDQGYELLEVTKKNLKVFHRILGRDESRQHLLMAARAALIVSDSAGSGLTRTGEEIDLWLNNAFNQEDILTEQSIRDKILIPRQQVIEKETGKPFQWQDFQTAAGDLPDRAVLLSSCGSGKTLAAWRWIAKRLAHRPKARAIFLYPTRATAAEGFRDYVSWAPEGMLLHSSNSFDLLGMFDDEDTRSGDSFLVEDRLFALAYWNRRIFSATVHQFFGFLQHSYRSVCLLPLLVDSVVVIDEVHSFDKALFSALKQLMATFDLPVLCMTATLPKQRRVELAELGLTLFPEDSSAFANLRDKAGASRYRVELLSKDRQEAEAIATESLQQGKKILWVVNTIDRCQEIARTFAYAKALCYHSRYTLEDRKQRHQELIYAFQKQTGSLLAVTTQVCEMSLDLDADVLISETAPITSMIQRMGRCNRRLENSDHGAVFFYNSENLLPYTEEDMIGTQDFLSALNGKTASQECLAELLDKFGNSARETERYAAFIKDRAWAKSRELLDIKETSIQAILDRDISRYRQLRKDGESTDGLLLPVPRFPKELSWEDQRIGSFPRVASANHYDPQFGFSRSPVVQIL
jgi:CRISPR-associated endonuclease/helicase Cas3